MSKRSITKIKEVRITKTTTLKETRNTPTVVYHAQKFSRHWLFGERWSFVEEATYDNSLEPRTFYDQRDAERHLNTFIASAKEVYGHDIMFDKTQITII